MSDAPEQTEETMVEEEVEDTSKHAANQNEPKIDVPIEWNHEAEDVSVYCSFDDFKAPVPLQPTFIRTKKGRQKKVFRGTLKLPVGMHLIRFQVDGEWQCDNNIEIVCSRGFEYNSLEVRGEDEDDESASEATVSPTPSSPSISATGASKDKDKKKKGEGDSKDASTSDKADDGDKNRDGADGAADKEKKKKKKRKNRKKDPQKIELDDAAITHAAAIAEESRRLEREWREAWIMHELKTHQKHEAELQQMRQKMDIERQAWLKKIKEFALDNKELRAQTLLQQSKLDSAEADKQLARAEVGRANSRAEAESRTLREEIDRMKKKIEDLIVDRDSRIEDVERVRTRLEAEMSELRAAETKARLQHGHLANELSDLRSEYESLQRQHKDTKADLEKKLASFRQQSVIDKNKINKQKDTMKSTMDSRVMGLTMQLEAKEKDVTAMRRKLEEVEQAENELKQANAALQSKIDQFSNEIEHTRQGDKADQARLASSMAEAREAESKASRLSVTLKTQLAEAKAEAEQYRKALDSEKSSSDLRLADVKRQLDAVSAELAASKNAQSHSVSEQIKDLSSKIDERDKALAEAKAQLSTANHSLADAKRQHQTLKAELEEARTSASSSLAGVEAKKMALLKEQEKEFDRLQQQLVERTEAEKKLTESVKLAKDAESDAQRQIGQLKRELDDSLKELAAVKNQVSVQKEKYDHQQSALLKDLNSLKGDKSSHEAALTTRVAELTAAVDTKENAIAEMQSQLNTRTHELADVRREVIQLKNDLDASRQQASSRLVEVTAQFEKQMKDLGVKDEATASALVEEQKAKAHVETALADLRKVEAETNRQLAAVRAELADSKAELDSLNQQFKAQQGMLETKSEEARSAMVSLAEKKQALETSETRFNDRVVQLNARIEELDKAYTAARNDVSQLNKALADAKRDIARLDAEKEFEKTEAAKKHADLETKRQTEMKQLQQDLQRASSQLTETQGELDTLKTEHRSLEEQSRTERAAAEDRLRDKQKELDLKKQELADEKEAAENKLQERIRDFSFKLDEKNLAISGHQRDLEIAQKNIADLKQKRDDLVAELEKTKSDLAQSKVSIENQLAKMKEIGERMEKIDEEKKALSARHQQEARELNDKVQTLQTNLSATTDKLEKSQSENAALKSKAEVDRLGFERERKEYQRQIDRHKTIHTALKNQIAVVNNNSKMFRSVLDSLKKSTLDMSQDFQKTIKDTTTGLFNTIDQQAKELAEYMKKYKKELSARRKYFNLVQELKGNIRVFCRSRPFLQKDAAFGSVCALSFPEKDTIVVDTEKNGKKVQSDYEFDKVFTEQNTQTDVFKETKPLIVSVMDGYNVCIFAYGQTGSGKTYTMEGPETDRGVNFRSLSELFRIKKARSKDYRYNISVSMKEIYNEKIKDLLADKVAGDDAEELKIVKGERGMFVKGLTLIPVETEEDVLALMKKGNSNRSVGRTNMNEHSSRSHSLLSVEVEGENLVAGIKYFGKLHLIDLAGSERLSKTGATGQRLEEAKNINKSLSALGNVIEALQQKAQHIPYRNSKLTFLLEDSLGGHAKTLMFINVSPTLADAEETNCSLLFASRVRKVELGTATKNVSAGSGGGGGEATEGEAAEGGAAAAGSPSKPASASAAAAPKSVVSPAAAAAPKTPAAAAKPGAAAAKPGSAPAKPAAPVKK